MPHIALRKGMGRWSRMQENQERRTPAVARNGAFLSILEELMQHTDQRAAGDAIPAGDSIKLSRRQALLGLSAMSGAAAISVGGKKLLDDMSPQDRMTHHLAEFRRAAEEADPRIKRWTTIELSTDEGIDCALLVSAYRS